MVGNIDAHDVSVLGIRMRLLAFLATPSVILLDHLLVAARSWAGRVGECVLGLAHHHNSAFGFKEELIGRVEVRAGSLELLKGHSRTGIALVVGSMCAEGGSLALLVIPVAEFVRTLILWVDLESAASKGIQRFACK